MGKKPEQSNKPKPDTLRSQAEAELVRARLMDATTWSADEMLHEIRVHQIELEMQNETLRDSQISLEKSRDRYADLYEFAPVGYLTLTREAMISEINLTGAILLGEDRGKLLKRRFSTLVSPGDRDSWHQLFRRALQHEERQSCELLMQHRSGTFFHAQLDGLHRIEQGDAPIVRFTITDISKIKEADQRYRNVFELATDSIVVNDADTGEIIEVNQTLADLVGKDKAELIGKPLHILFPSTFLERVPANERRYHADKHGAEVEAQLVTSMGQIRDVEIKISVMRMSGRNVEFGIIRDITERRQAGANEHRLRHILSNTMDMIFIFSPDRLNFEYVNKGAARGVGYSQEELLRMTAPDVLSLISEAECRAFIAPLIIRKKQTLRFETVLERKDGRKVSVEAQLQLVQENGDSGLFVAIVRDITRRKFAEKELRRQKNLMWQVIDMDPSMIFVRDNAGRFLLANRAVAKFFDLSIPDMIGKSSSELLTYPQEAPGFLASDLDVLDSGHEITLTESLVMPDGKQHWYMVIKRPMQTPSGTTNILGIAADISDLKLSGIRLDESYRELQRLALHLESIRAEERTQIARNLHDEMGATLAALKMRVAWLASKLPAGMPLLTAEVNHISELVSAGITTVRQVVSDLRPNLLDDVGLGAAIKDYIKRYQHDSEIECNIVLPEQDFALSEDQSVTIFRIIQEALSNVAQHAQASKVDLLIELHGDLLRLKIEDNGIGFDPALKGQSFGLLGIKERALMIGGSATVESAPGHGTHVLLNMPLVHLSKHTNKIETLSVPLHQPSLDKGKS